MLQVNDRLRIDAALEVGGLEETTTVQASAPVVRSDSSEVGTVIEETAIKELPLNGRNFATLVYLVPGITPGQANENLSGASTFNPRGASNFNALGHQANSNGWLVDGIDNNEFTFNTVIVSPSVEQVREFKVLSGVFSAEFGRGAGVVSVSTKSGTNQLRGTAFEFLRNDAFDARNFFVRKTPQADGSLLKDPVPPLDRHQFGGALGGALVIPGVYDGHNRTFFFADYAGIKERRGVTTVNTVPTAATRAGDFSNYRDRNGNLIVIYDPLTTRLDADGRIVRDPFPGNVIPQNRIHEVGRNIASIYPTAEQRLGELRQLHLDARSRDHGSRVLGPRRSPVLRQGLGLLPLQLRQVPARRAAGPGELLSADARGGRRPVRPRSVRRRHPEHEADDARRRLQLLAASSVPRSSTSSASAMRARSRSRRNPTTGIARRSRWASGASTSARSRPGCRTSTSRTSRGFRADRRSCPSIRRSSTTRSRTRWSGSKGVIR